MPSSVDVSLRPSISGKNQKSPASGDVPLRRVSVEFIYRTQRHGDTEEGTTDLSDVSESGEAAAVNSGDGTQRHGDTEEAEDWKRGARGVALGKMNAETRPRPSLYSWVGFGVLVSAFLPCEPKIRGCGLSLWRQTIENSAVTLLQMPTFMRYNPFLEELGNVVTIYLCLDDLCLQRCRKWDELNCNHYLCHIEMDDWICSDIHQVGE